MGRKRGLYFNCTVCGKEFYRKPSHAKIKGSKSCSIKCKNKLLEKPSSWATKKCKRCGKKFTFYKSTRRKPTYCSYSCTARRSKGGIIKIKCPLCQKYFPIFKSHFKYRKNVSQFNQVFCSPTCAGLWRQENAPYFKNTSIELALKEELESNNIPFEQHKVVESIACVDFSLLNKIIIQADGEYWHSFPNQKARDIKQDIILTLRGYKVFRFWGKDIKKSTSNCINIVREYINEISP